MVSLAKKILCPYCFRHFEASEMDWRCNSAACNSSGMLPDQLFQAYMMELLPNSPPQLKGYAFKVDRSKKSIFSFKSDNTQKCNQCKKESTQRLCPHCHNDLPYTMETVENHIISILGAKSVGKTHYIAVLITELRRLGAEFGFTVLDLNDKTTQRYKQQFYSQLYRDKRALSVSQVTDPQPLMYRVKFDGANSILSKGKSLTIVFFDTAGENFDDETSMSLRTRYLIHSSALLLLVDPLQIEGVRDRLAGTQCQLPNEHTEPTEIIGRLIRLFKSHSASHSDKKIQPPIAVAFTKSDVLRDYSLLPAGNAVYGQPRHHVNLNENVRSMISDEIQSLFVGWKTSELEMHLKQNFRQYSYFCLSALGESPDPAGNLTTVAPFRVEDPFFWLLSELSYMKRTPGK